MYGEQATPPISETAAQQPDRTSRPCLEGHLPDAASQNRTGHLDGRRDLFGRPNLLQPVVPLRHILICATGQIRPEWNIQ